MAADYDDDDDFVGGDGLPLVEGDVPATIEPMGKTWITLTTIILGT